MFESVLFFLVSLLCFGVAAASFVLKLTYYLKDPRGWKLFALVFIGYLMVFVGVMAGGQYLFVLEGGSRQMMIVMRILLMGGLMVMAPFLVYQMLGIKGGVKAVLIPIAAGIYVFGSLFGELVHPSAVIVIGANVVMGIAFFWVLLDPMFRWPRLRNGALNLLLRSLVWGSMVFLPLLFWEKTLSLFSPSIRYESYLLLFLFLICLADLIYLIYELSRPATPVHQNLEDLPRETFLNLGLTAREVDVVLLVEKGLTYKEIGQELSIAPNTVGNHIIHVYRKLGAGTKTEMLRILYDRAFSGPSGNSL